MKIKRLAYMTVAALLVGLVAAPSASATTTTLGPSDVYTNGSWTNYPTERVTGSSGQIKLDLTNCTANNLNLYLRNQYDTRISDVQDWPNSAGGYRAFYVRGTTSTTFAAGTRFKFSGRVNPAIESWEDNTWGGTLMLN